MLADTIRITGLVHTICGMEALDEALQDLAARASDAAVGFDAQAVHPEPGRWLDDADALAGKALEDAAGLAEFTADAGADDLRTLAEMLREAGSANLKALADRLAP